MSKRTITLVAGSTLLAGLIVTGWLMGAPGCREVKAVGGWINLDAASLLPGEAQAFCYADREGEKLRFVLARGADGKVRSVFDACRQCFSYDRGYAAEGGSLICRVCGNRYPIDRMLEGKASCVPVKLAHRDGPESVRIKVTDLTSGRALF